jgi:hypothetical protein
MAPPTPVKVEVTCEAEPESVVEVPTEITPSISMQRPHPIFGRVYHAIVRKYHPNIISTTPSVIGIALLVRRGDAIWAVQHPLRPAIVPHSVSARGLRVLLAQAAKTKRVPV